MTRKSWDPIIEIVNKEEQSMTDNQIVASIHLANTESGEYDVLQPQPYPYFIDADGAVARQDFWRGEPERLIGFQCTTAKIITLTALEWLELLASDTEDDPDLTGWWPVFEDAGGTFWTHRFPIDEAAAVRR